MKKLLVFIASIALALMVVGCTQDCQTVASACSVNDSYKCCCTPFNCYYLYKGVRYDCDGKDCYEAAKKMIAVMCTFYKQTDVDAVRMKTNEVLAGKCATCPQ